MLCAGFHGSGCVLRYGSEADFHLAFHGIYLSITAGMLTQRLRRACQNGKRSRVDLITISMQAAAVFFGLWGFFAVPLLPCKVWQGLNLRVATFLYASYHFLLLQFFYWKQEEITSMLPAISHRRNRVFIDTTRKSIRSASSNDTLSFQPRSPRSAEIAAGERSSRRISTASSNGTVSTSSLATPSLKRASRSASITKVNPTLPMDKVVPSPPTCTTMSTVCPSEGGNPPKLLRDNAPTTMLSLPSDGEIEAWADKALPCVLEPLPSLPCPNELKPRPDLGKGQKVFNMFSSELSSIDSVDSTTSFYDKAHGTWISMRDSMSSTPRIWKRWRSFRKRVLYGALGPLLYFYLTFIAIAIGFVWLFVAVRVEVDAEGACWMASPEGTASILVAVGAPLPLLGVGFFARPLLVVKGLEPSIRRVVWRNLAGAIAMVVTTAGYFSLHVIGPRVFTPKQRLSVQLYAAWVDVVVNSVLLAVVLGDFLPDARRREQGEFLEKLSKWSKGFDAGLLVALFEADTLDAEGCQAQAQMCAASNLKQALKCLRGVRLSDINKEEFGATAPSPATMFTKRRLSKEEIGVVAMPVRRASRGELDREIGRIPTFVQMNLGKPPPEDVSFPCGFGDIDIFVSHSWHDDPDEKIFCLRRVAREFAAEHGREPVMWIDKWCIDQENIGEILRFLPIFLMASQRCIALMGPTYLQRAWCCWELFMLIGSGMKSCHNLQIELLAGFKLPAAMSDGDIDFDFTDCECREEADKQRMLEIVESSYGGLEYFNKSVKTFCITEARKELLRSTEETRSRTICSNSETDIFADARLGRSPAIVPNRQEL